MKHTRLLVGLIISTIVFGNQLAIAQNIEDISSQANKFTIRISGSETGSGVIIEKNNNIYTAITNWHVVDTQGLYKVLTFDNKEYSVTNIQRLTGLDIAIIQFTSNQTYPIIELNNSSEISAGSTVYVVGWADPTAGIYSERTFQFLRANVISRLISSKDGYAIVHDNPAIPGTSGGPVIDTDARLVAINGEAKADINTGRLFGRSIPIQVIVAARRNSVVPQEENFPVARSIDLIPPIESDFILVSNGSLESGDQVLESDNSIYDEYTFNGQVGQRVTITLESSDFDAYLAVFTPDNKLLEEHDDISQTNSNSAITTTLPQTGIYRVIINSHDSKGRGEYELKVRSNTENNSVENSSESDSTLVLNGSLESGDQVLESDNSIYDEHTFNGQEGQEVTITLESSDFDTYLAIFTPDDKLLEEHDDISQTNSNSAITTTLPQTGTYRVIINSYDSKGRGKYELKVNFLE